MTRMALSRLHFPVRTLGPGQRVGVWFQGCSIRCPGCISVDTWEAGLGMTTVEEVLGAIDPWVEAAEGLTVSGGEPFDQPDALETLLLGWRERSPASVLLFTGHVFETVAPWLRERAGLVDAVVAGPYQRSAPQTLALRGSDNQTLHLLSPRGEAFAAYDRPLAEGDRRLDVMFDEDGMAWFAGIPAQGDFAHLRLALEALGHQVRFSDRGR